ncbi:MULTISPECIES: hypothetical protein [Azospirillaceae]|nr:MULTISPECIES: hypothetical protein [Azospirillaceae]
MLRFNHMELTVQRGFVAAHGADVVRFFTTIFGFRQGAFPGLETPHLILTTDEEASQFLFICESDTPSSAPGDDHLGFHLDTAADIDACLAACRHWQEQEGGVEIRVLDDLDLEQTLTHAFYVRYRLPIWFDIQHIAAKPGFEPARRWRFG